MTFFSLFLGVQSAPEVSGVTSYETPCIFFALCDVGSSLTNSRFVAGRRRVDEKQPGSSFVDLRNRD